MRIRVMIAKNGYHIFSCPASRLSMRKPIGQAKGYNAMKTLSIILSFLFLATSLLNFIMCAIDKSAAKRDARRIPEKRFFLLALCGGGFGLWCGMLCFRHKTKHWYFWLVAVCTTIFQLFLLVWIALKIGGAL